jgi:hypothetical protein
MLLNAHRILVEAADRPLILLAIEIPVTGQTDGC